MYRAQRLSAQTQAQPESAPHAWEQPAFHVVDRRRAAERGAFSEREGAGPAAPAKARISQPLLVGALLLFDSLNIPASGYAAYLVAAAPQPPDAGLLTAGLAATTLLAILALQTRWTYTIRAMGDFPRQSLNLALALGGALAFWTAASVIAGFDDVGFLRGWTLAWFSGGWAAGSLARAVFAIAVKSWTAAGPARAAHGDCRRRPACASTVRRLERSGRGALDILGLFDDRGRERLPEQIGDYALLGSFDHLETFCREQKVDLLIVAIPTAAETRILQILKQLWTLPVDIRISALGSRLKLRDRAYQFIGDVPFLPVFDKPISDWGAALKTLFDRIAAALLILVLSPVLAAVALGVKLSSTGPVLFRQTRYGFNNEKFAVFKFRSMYVGCSATPMRPDW